MGRFSGITLWSLGGEIKMWSYIIKLNDFVVGDNGDLEFETEQEAQADADDYIISELADEFNVQCNEFEVEIWEEDE